MYPPIFDYTTLHRRVQQLNGRENYAITAPSLEDKTRLKLQIIVITFSVAEMLSTSFI